MNPINIKSTSTTPEVILDKETGVLKVEGISEPNNPEQFYTPVIEWLEEYTEDPNPETMFIFKLTSFNDDSTKPLLNILGTIEYLDNLTVQWHYADGDSEMKEAGEDFQEMVDVEFDIKAY